MRPSFPSLYNPHIELDSRRHGTTQLGGKYLDNARDVFRFTLYWMFILHVPLFLLTGTCAALILALEPLRRRTPTPAQKRSAAYAAAVFLVYATAGAMLTVLSSVVLGFLIAGVYAAGRFRVSTWVPFVWALLQALVSATSMCSLIIDII